MCQCRKCIILRLVDSKSYPREPPVLHQPPRGMILEHIPGLHFGFGVQDGVGEGLAFVGHQPPRGIMLEHLMPSLQTGRGVHEGDIFGRGFGTQMPPVLEMLFSLQV